MGTDDAVYLLEKRLAVEVAAKVADSFLIDLNPSGELAESSDDSHPSCLDPFAEDLWLDKNQPSFEEVLDVTPTAEDTSYGTLFSSVYDRAGEPHVAPADYADDIPCSSAPGGKTGQRSEGASLASVCRNFDYYVPDPDQGAGIGDAGHNLKRSACDASEAFRGEARNKKNRTGCGTGDSVSAQIHGEVMRRAYYICTRFVQLQVSEHGAVSTPDKLLSSIVQHELSHMPPYHQNQI